MYIHSLVITNKSYNVIKNILTWNTLTTRRPPIAPDSPAHCNTVVRVAAVVDTYCSAQPLCFHRLWSPHECIAPHAPGFRCHTTWSTANTPSTSIAVDTVDRCTFECEPPVWFRVSRGMAKPLCRYPLGRSSQLTPRRHPGRRHCSSCSPALSKCRFCPVRKHQP